MNAALIIPAALVLAAIMLAFIQPIAPRCADCGERDAAGWSNCFVDNLFRCVECWATLAE